MSYQLDQSKNALEIRVLETLNPTGKLSAHTFQRDYRFPSPLATERTKILPKAGPYLHIVSLAGKRKQRKYVYI